MPALITQLFAIFGPIVLDIIAKFQANNNGAFPTDAQMLAAFTANVDKYLKEGSDWRATHPNA